MLHFTALGMLVFGCAGGWCTTVFHTLGLRNKEIIGNKIGFIRHGGKWYLVKYHQVVSLSTKNSFMFGLVRRLKKHLHLSFSCTLFPIGFAIFIFYLLNVYQTHLIPLNFLVLQNKNLKIAFSEEIIRISLSFKIAQPCLPIIYNSTAAGGVAQFKKMDWFICWCKTPQPRSELRVFFREEGSQRGLICLIRTGHLCGSCHILIECNMICLSEHFCHLKMAALLSISIPFYSIIIPLIGRAFIICSLGRY